MTEGDNRVEMQPETSADSQYNESSKYVISTFITVLQLDNKIRRRRGEGLILPRMEMNRQDSSDIAFIWTGDDAVNRNVHAVFDEGAPTQLSVQVNAWKDTLREDGSLEARDWNHSAIGELQVTGRSTDLEGLLSTAYQTVLGWGPEDLIRHEVYQPQEM